jgi:hypothetical protein
MSMIIFIILNSRVKFLFFHGAQEKYGGPLFYVKHIKKGAWLILKS